MSDFLCPKSGEACELTALCTAVNAPLQEAIPTIRRQVGGVRWSLAKWVLQREMTSQGNHLTVDLAPTIDRDGTARMCPRDIIEGQFGEQHGVEKAALAMTRIAENCVANTIADLTK